MTTEININGRYELKQVLARGGMGVVYRAVDLAMRRPVAIKTLLDNDNTSFELFQRECEVLASMTHPNIVEIYDVAQFEENGVLRPFLVMPLLHGCTLDGLIRAQADGLTVERTVDIACQVCRGLQAAHERGLVHRDIKPSNIFVMEDDSVKLIDFGVAHRVEATRTVGRKGTLLYMSPEQVDAKPVTAASDIFSLGVVCYEALTRRRPFERTTENSIVDAILRLIPPPISELNPGVSRPLGQAIHKAMAKQPWHRYQSARDFAETMRKALRNDAIEMFNPQRIRPRLQRAAEAFERGDFEFASEIVGEMEGEGHLDPGIAALRASVNQAIRARTIRHLLETARNRIQEEEYPLALQKLYEILQLDPDHADASSLKREIETKRTEREIAELLELSERYLADASYANAREVAQRILDFQPAEPRAVQLLREIDRRQEEWRQARAEADELYRAAVESEQRGEISSALSKLERVLDLDRRASDRSSPERTAAHQERYDQVRAVHEHIQAAYAQALHRLNSADFAGARTICEEQLAKYPKNAIFQSLKLDIDERQRQALSAHIAEATNRFDAEPDLERRIAILEEALAVCPGEAHLEALLKSTCEKHNLVASIVARAQMHEREMQFGEALSQWDILRTIYSRYPGLRDEIDRLTRRREEQLRAEARQRWVVQVDQSLEKRDYSRALDLLHLACKEHPADEELAQLERVAQSGLNKSRQVEDLLAQGREEWHAGRHPDAIAKYEEAASIDERDPGPRSILRDALIDAGRFALETDPASAEALLRRAIDCEPQNAAALSLLRVITDRRAHQASNTNEPARKPLYPDDSVVQTITAVSGESSPVPTATSLPTVTELQESPGADDPPTLSAVSAVVSGESRRDIALPNRREKTSSEPPSDKSGTHRGVALRYAAGIAGAALLLTLGSFAARNRHVEKNVSTGILEISTVPANAPVWAIRGGNRTLVSSGRLSLPVGAVHLEAALPGYRPVRRDVEVERSVHKPVILELAPVATLSLLLPGAAEVFIDGGTPEHVTAGQYRTEASAGKHSVRIDAHRDGSVVFDFIVSNEGPPVLAGPLSVHEAAAFVVANFGRATRVYGSGPPAPVVIAGRRVGELTRDGLDLPDLRDGTHALELGGAGYLRKRTVETGPDRTLTLMLEGDPNAGGLLVQTNEEDVTVVLLLNGKEIVRENMKSRTQRWAGLPARVYAVRVQKDGFETDTPERRVEVKKGEDNLVAFELRPRRNPSTVRVRLTPGSDLYLDDQSLGTIATEYYTLNPIEPGTHSIKSQKLRFVPAAQSFALAAEQKVEIDLRLSPAPIPVEIRRFPPDSIVTFARRGEPGPHEFKGNRMELPEGHYEFVARASGYLETAATRDLTWDLPMPIDLRQTSAGPAAVAFELKDWPAATWTSRRDGYLIKEGPARIFFSKSIPTGVLQFQAGWDGKGPAQWLVQYIDERSYVLCELDNGVFRVTRFVDGKATILTPATPVPKSDWYVVVIELEPGRIKHSLQIKGSLQLLNTQPLPAVKESKFGFAISKGQTLRLAQFAGHSRQLVESKPADGSLK